MMSRAARKTDLVYDRRMADPAPFVGRRLELAELESALSAAQDGGGGFILIAGEPGIGKTTLCSSFSESARRRGARVFWGRTWEWGGAPPFWPWVQVLRNFAGNAADDSQLRLGALEALAGEPSSDAGFVERGASTRFALFDVVTKRLQAAAQAGPVVVILEDLHAADVPTVLLLRFVVEQLRDAAVLVLGTWRTVESSPSAELASLMTDVSRIAKTIDLRGLATADIAEFMQKAVPDHPAATAAELHDRTGGNPLLVASLLQGGVLADSSEALPTRARAAVERRIARLNPDVRSVLSAASVIGREMAVLLLAKVCERRLDEILEQVRTLVAECIFVERREAPGRYGFCHGLFREVVYGALAPTERLKLHRAAGFALEELYGADREAHLSELARHFLAVSPDPERGVEYALGAGDRAMYSLAFEDAVAHYGRAIAALDSTSLSAGRLGTLWAKSADALASAGTTTSAHDAYRRAHRIALDTANASLEVQVAIGFARVVGFGRSDDESIRWLEHALDAANDPATRIRLLAALIDRTWMLPNSIHRVEALSRDVLDLARALGDPRLHAQALASTLVMIWVPPAFAQCCERADELLAIAERVGDPELQLQAYRWRFTTCMIAGAISEAKRALDVYERLAEQLDRPQLRFNVILRRAMFAGMEARFEDVLAFVPPARDAARRAGDLQGDFLTLGMLLQVHRARDDRTAMEETFDQLEHVIGNDLPPSVRAAMRAAVRAQLGQSGEARRALDRYFELAPSFLGGGGPFALACATWAVWHLKETARARELLPLLSPYEDLVLMGGAAEFHGPGSLYLGLASAIAGDMEAAERYLQKAIIELDGMGAAHYAALARQALATVTSGAERHGGSAAAASDFASGVTQGVFVAEGDYYLVGLGAKRTRVRASKGLVLIETLLKREGAEVHVLELADSALDDRSEGPLLDERAKAEYRARIVSLRAELDEAEEFADLGRSVRIREELESVESELSRAIGLGGRNRTTGTAERARARVTLAIRRAVKNLEGTQPDVAAHLGASITTGTFCVYRPEPRARILWCFDGPVDS